MNKKNKFKNLKFVLVGFGAGAINGFFGAGAGLIIVPALSFASMEESKIIHATTVVCVLFMSVVSSVFYFVSGNVDLTIIVPVVIGGTMGGVIGTFLLKKLRSEIIDLIFSIVLILSGILMIIF